MSRFRFHEIRIENYRCFDELRLPLEEDTTVLSAENGGGTFPVHEGSEEREHGEYRTKRGVLETHDALTAATESGTPYHPPLGPPRRTA